MGVFSIGRLGKSSSPAPLEHFYDEDYIKIESIYYKTEVFFSFGIFHLLQYMVYLDSFEVNGNLFIDFNGSWIRPLVKSSVQRHCANFKLETNPFRRVAPNGILGFAGGG